MIAPERRNWTASQAAKGTCCLQTTYADGGWRFAAS